MPMLIYGRQIKVPFQRDIIFYERIYFRAFYKGDAVLHRAE